MFLLLFQFAISSLFFSIKVFVQKLAQNNNVAVLSERLDRFKDSSMKSIVFVMFVRGLSGVCVKWTGYTFLVVAGRIWLDYWKESGIVTQGSLFTYGIIQIYSNCIFSCLHTCTLTPFPTPPGSPGSLHLGHDILGCHSGHMITLSAHKPQLLWQHMH